jgi:hypothetical protein
MRYSGVKEDGTESGRMAGPMTQPTSAFHESLTGDRRLLYSLIPAKPGLRRPLQTPAPSF